MVRLLNQADWRIERAFACCYLGPARQLHKMNVPRLFLGLGGGVRDLSGPLWTGPLTRGRIRAGNDRASERHSCGIGIPRVIILLYLVTETCRVGSLGPEDRKPRRALEDYVRMQSRRMRQDYRVNPNSTNKSICESSRSRHRSHRYA